MEFPVWECDWIPILNSTLSVRWTSQRIHFQHVLKPRQQALDFARSPEHFPIDCEEIHHLVAEGKQMIEWYRYKLQEHIDLIWLPNRAVSNRVAGKRSQWDQHDHTPIRLKFGSNWVLQTPKWAAAIVETTQTGPVTIHLHFSFEQKSRGEATTKVMRRGWWSDDQEAIELQVKRNEHSPGSSSDSELPSSRASLFEEYPESGSQTVFNETQ